MTQRTPLYDEHVKLGAKIIDFAGWEMPIQYTGVIDEHRAVRTKAGLFDVSHMGEIDITGPDALALVQHLTVNDVRRLAPGQAQYSVMCNERGGVIDDVIVYRLAAEHFLLVVNASNREKDVRWVKSHATGNVTVRDVSDDYALLALQGPAAEGILASLCNFSLTDIASFSFRWGRVAGKENCIVARTGYTGEAGFELFTPAASAAPVWRTLLDAGKNAGLVPAGLGARDTLRLEMNYCLYGHELSEEITPLEAGLGWVVKLDSADDFIGKQALVEQKRAGLKRRLVGFRLLDRGVARAGYAVLAAGKRIGEVTSGTMSPTLGIPIGLAFVLTPYAAIGSKFSVDIRGTAREAEAVKTPFYKKK